MYERNLEVDSVNLSGCSCAVTGDKIRTVRPMALTPPTGRRLSRHIARYIDSSSSDIVEKSGTDQPLGRHYQRHSSWVPQCLFLHRRVTRSQLCQRNSHVLCVVYISHCFNRPAAPAQVYSLGLILRTASSSQVTSKRVNQQARSLLSVSEVPAELRLSALMLKE